MSDQQIMIKMEQLPSEMKQEVADFIDYLLHKKGKVRQEPPRRRPVFGSGKGLFKMADDFDAPLEDFEEYM